jgi:uncharacterized protein with ATP-grasp and redox domains
VTDYSFPPPRGAALPPLLLTSDPNSFAHNTFRVRVPAILRETIALNAFPPHIAAALEALYDELVGGAIRGLEEETPDRAFWDAVSRPYIGRAWLDAPWYWAEAFYYRRVLEATRYFGPSIWAGFDPYAARKQAEWRPEAAPAAVAALLDALPADPERRLEALLHASLWGNRTDLSYEVAAGLGGASTPHSERHYLLCDDSAAILRHLGGRPGAEIILIADNAGTELTMDLALIDGLLDPGGTGRVALHLKPQPFYVSDAMPADVLNCLDALDAVEGAVHALAARLRVALRERRLLLVTHWAYTSSLFYSQAPEDLFATLAQADLVLFKGDANYRRLVGDAHWPPAAPFAGAVAYFPAPLAALRTMKSELIVGLGPGEAERLAGEDPDWLVNGRRGVIQARL